MAELQPLTQMDFSGGENVVTSPYLVGKKQSQQLVNFLLDEHGSARVRDGTLVQGVASPNTGQPVVKIYDFIHVDGTIDKLAIAKTNAGNNKLFKRDANPWTLVGTFNSAANVPDAATFTNTALFAHSNAETPWSLTAAGAFAQIMSSSGAVPQGGAHQAVHLGVYWLWNTFTSTGALDGPSSLRSSDVNNIGSYPAANQTFINKDDGQTGQGIGLFTIAETGISPTAVLIAFKDFSAFEVSGTFGASSFSVQKIKTDMGCVAPRTIQFVAGFGIIRLTHKGFALFDGVNDTLISEEERPRLFGRDTFTGINWAQVGLSYATQVQNPPLYICACPVSGTSLTRVFIYDLVRKAWTVATFANAISTLQLIADPNVLPVVLGGDFSGSRVRRYFAGDADDDGVAVAWQLRTRPAFVGAPLRRAYFRRLVMKEFAMAALSSVSFQFFYGPSSVTNSKTVPSTTTLSPFSGFGIDAYGSTGFGAGVNTNTTDVDIEVGIGVKANNIFCDVTGTGAGRIRGIEWHARAVPLTRPTIAA